MSLHLRFYICEMKIIKLATKGKYEGCFYHIIDLLLPVAFHTTIAQIFPQHLFSLFSLQNAFLTDMVFKILVVFQERHCFF